MTLKELQNDLVRGQGKTWLSGVNEHGAWGPVTVTFADARAMQVEYEELKRKSDGKFTDEEVKRMFPDEIDEPVKP